VVPAATPKALITKLNAEANKALAMPEVKERLSGAGIDVGGGSPEDYAKFVRDELAKWGPVVKASGAKLD
jgi:tripartite-type tricarboxylate transporter receptor subunit TctC